MILANPFYIKPEDFCEVTNNMAACDILSINASGRFSVMQSMITKLSDEVSMPGLWLVSVHLQDFIFTLKYDLF